jgi:cytochrome c2
LIFAAKYIADPKSAMPGNKMAFVGIKDDVADLIAYLKMFDADGKQSK